MQSDWSITMTDQLIRPLATHLQMFTLPQIVEMIREYIQVSHSTRSETEELERLASQLTLSETPKQVHESGGCESHDIIWI